MDWRVQILAAVGYQILEVSGAYCRATRDDQDVILCWDTDHWRVL